LRLLCGSYIARGEALLRAGTMTARARSACWRLRLAQVLVARRPRVAVPLDRDELVQPGSR